MSPARMNGIDLAAMLRRMALGIEREDSFGGSIEYEALPEPDMYEVTGAIRYGNRNGQGGVILIQAEVE